MYEFQGIGLRKLQRDDLPDLLFLKGESWETTHHITIANMEDQNRWFESLDRDVHSPRNLVLVGTFHDNPKFGIFKITGIDWVSRTADAAWDVFKTYRGKGLGKPLVLAGVAFCFNILNLWRVNCEILELNVASQKCALNAGFQKEGVKRESIIKQGGYVDSGVYGVLARDFAALHGVPDPV